MYLVLPQQLAAQHIAELHQQAARQRLIRELRARPERAARHRRRMRRLLLRRPRRQPVSRGTVPSGDGSRRRRSPGGTRAYRTPALRGHRSLRRRLQPRSRLR